MSLIIKEKIILSAHDISEGGLMITLLEKGFYNNLGFDVKANFPIRKESFWFGECQSRIVVTCSKDNVEKLKSIIEKANIQYTVLGTVTSGAIKVNDEDWGNIISWKEKYDTAIEKIINSK